MKEAIFLALFLGQGTEMNQSNSLNQKVEISQVNTKKEGLEKILYNKSFKVDIFDYGTKKESLLINLGKFFEYKLEFIVFQDYSNRWCFDWVVNGKKHRVFDFSYDEMKKEAKPVYIYPDRVGINYHLHEYKRRDRFEIKKEMEEGPFILKAEYSILFIYDVRGWNKTSGYLSIQLDYKGYVPVSTECPEY